MANTNRLNEEVGLLRRGSIFSYDKRKGTISVKLNNASTTSANTPVVVQAPHSMFYNNGLFIGTLPQPGTPVVVGSGSGGEYYFVSFLSENIDNVPTLIDGELLIRSNDATKISLNSNNDINIGSDKNRIHINTSLNYMSRNFYNDYKFTQAGRKVEGVIKRDLIRNTNYSQASKLESDNYEPEYYVIAMDPSTSPSSIISGSAKNPPFVEQRETTYEFQNISNITDDLNESASYSDSGGQAKTYTYPNRRLGRADTLSLSLVAPNYLMETIKGTVVDIFGNILDLNRNPLPVGKDQNTIQPEKTADKVKSFLNIKALERKSLAYHFEINARKDLSGKDGKLSLPNIFTNKNYARDRSRFFVDIDKEGQFKLNVPASSESGNIPLLTRYENYSTYGSEDGGNPNKLIALEGNRDIFQDSFASPAVAPSSGGFLPINKDDRRGSISLKSSDGAAASPIDRLTNQHINHGMAYHDIMQTCFLHQNNDFLNFQAGEVDPLTVDLSTIPPLKNIASASIITSGPSANGGGRSGSMNLDGSLELNIGANTVDRQSLWLDTAGGIVTNIGRDRNGRSIVAATGGDVYLQVGGFGITADTRFTDQQNGILQGVLDLRIMGSGGFCHMIRVDKYGVTILTPGALKIHSKKDMTLTSDKDIRIECNTLVLQERMHLKTFGGSS